MAGLAKFILGVSLAIAILFFTGVSAARYLITRLTAPPPRPVFPNDNPLPEASVPTDSPAPESSPDIPPAAAPEVVEAPSPSPIPTPTPSPTLGYQARVVEPIGLILRQDATQESAQIGGVEFNATVEILESSPDGEWQRVRLANGQEGWIKAGNTTPLESQVP